MLHACQKQNKLVTCKLFQPIGRSKLQPTGSVHEPSPPLQSNTSPTRGRGSRVRGCRGRGGGEQHGGGEGCDGGNSRRGRGRGRRGQCGRGHRGSRGRGNPARQSGSHQPGEDESEWSETANEVVVEAFDQAIGPTISTSSDPTEMFLAFFTPELIDYIVVQTNWYASVCLSSTHCGDGPVPQWETDSNEVKAYLGLCILMGMSKLPDLYDYWSTDEAFHYTPVASRITRKCFLEIQRYLHFTNNDSIVSRGEPGYD